MTLPSSGQITTAQFRAEMDNLVGDLVFPSAGTLWLAGKAAAPIVIPTDYHGKTWGPTLVQTTRFGATSSPGSQFTIPGGAPWAAGDLVVICQYAEADGAAPASVTPSGFTNITTSQTLNLGTGAFARMNSSYRIITAGQPGATFTAMNGTNRNRVCGFIAHFNRPLTGVTVVDQGAAISVGTPSALNSAWNSVRDGSHIYIGQAHGEVTIDNSNYTWTTPPSEAGSPSITRTYAGMYTNSAPASSITAALADTGAFNGHVHMLLRLT